MLGGRYPSVGDQITGEGVLTQATLPHQVKQGAGLEEVRHGELLEEEAVTNTRDPQWHLENGFHIFLCIL